jgi:hypothetical protein
MMLAPARGTLFSSFTVPETCLDGVCPVTAVTDRKNASKQNESNFIMAINLDGKKLFLSGRDKKATVVQK